MKEEDIRPAGLFDELLRLAARDTDLFFRDAPRERIGCPICDTPGVFSFEKHNFAYEECPDCHSLFVSPRPAAAAFSRYYRESESSKFWATSFYRETETARRERLWKPKARRVRELLLKYAPEDVRLYDIGAGYGVFAEEMRALGVETTAIEPAPHLAAILREKGFHVVEAFLEDVASDEVVTGPKAFASFELFEHLHDPALFLRRLRAMMRPDDLFIFTTLSSDGIDIRLLWNNSKSVSPPHHLNFANPSSIAVLLRRTGFECLEVTTPGALDMDILRKNVALVTDRPWRLFLESASDEQCASMQALLAAVGLSSHMMVVCRATGSADD